MTVQIERIAIPTAHGTPLGVTKYSSPKHKERTIVVSSATGVLQQYYSKFAQYFASQGFIVYTFDYSGIGESLVSTKSLSTFEGDLKSWGSIDQATVIDYAKYEYEHHTITLIAHSIGGQLLGFNTNYRLIDKAVLVACQSGYWKEFRGIHRYKMWLFWYFLIPGLTPLFGYFPAKKLGLFENLPKRMVYEWASWGRKEAYMMHFENKTDYFFDAFKIPILSLSFHEDPFAPQNTVDWLARVYTNSKVTRVHHDKTPQERSAKHFGFFKSAYKEVFWERTHQWMLNNTYQ
ncbi:MAG: alpha/beta fold hydrolase [Maribacter sp.]